MQATEARSRAQGLDAMAPQGRQQILHDISAVQDEVRSEASPERPPCPL